LSPSMPQMWNRWSQNCISVGFPDLNFRQFTPVIGFCNFLIINERTTQTFLLRKSFGSIFLVVAKHASDVKSLITKLFKCRFPGFTFLQIHTCFWVCNFLIIIERTTQTFLWPKYCVILFLVVARHASDRSELVRVW